MTTRRRVDVPALIFGLIFMAIAGFWFLDMNIGFGLPATGWLIALALIALGVLGILGALRSNSNR
jgi:hypothetical protein